ncbi:hypothetical protein RHGRI_021073 [Rhododendron griersonianum]|uniref:Uncharacterized protein n=1 Tax=Rhododendron griersonianum TaxID=479676 RepID=A0AAV6JP30_9ERIC|nr:hypothetical protein RHGRI_021073 [Rhododendron griersonianum]
MKLNTHPPGLSQYREGRNGASSPPSSHAAASIAYSSARVSNIATSCERVMAKDGSITALLGFVPSPLVHGLLHLLGFDHEISDEAEAEMEEEELLLKTLGWKGKGLIRSAYDADHGTTHLDNTYGNFNGIIAYRKKQGSLRFYKPKFSYIFCDMDGTLLNSQSQITSTTAQALREASSRGLKVVIATGKACSENDEVLEIGLRE